MDSTNQWIHSAIAEIDEALALSRQQNLKLLKTSTVFGFLFGAAFVVTLLLLVKHFL